MGRVLNFYKGNKKIFENFSYLTLLQVFLILIPLLLYPYLVRVLGTEVYGRVLYSQAIAMYFSILINFGFNIIATNEISKQRESKAKISEIVSSTYILKFFLWLLSFGLFTMFVMCVTSLRDYWLLHLITFGVTFNELLFPQWYFQGVEKMKYITYIQIVTKLLFAFCVFLLVNSQDDYLKVAILYTLGAFINGVVAVYIVVKVEGVKLQWQNFERLKFYFKESLPLFLSSASIQVYVNANRVLVGTFLGMSEVAYYDLGEKILKLLKIPVGMLGQSAFPSLSKSKDVKKINQLMWLGVGVTSLLVGCVFVFSDFIVSVLGGDKMVSAIPVLRILSLSSIAVAFSQFLGVSRLIVFGFKAMFTKLIASSALFFTLITGLLYVFQSINLNSLSWTAVMVEFWVTITMFIYSYKKKILW